ncbi:MAG: isopentenyl-diphosphate delta-isomerase [Bacteroidota bacterium]
MLLTCFEGQSVQIFLMASSPNGYSDVDLTAFDRKKDHIELAFKSRVTADQLDQRFYYEPIFAAHPDGEPEPFSFLERTMHYPIWVSSMTGGTNWAGTINKNLARACGEFGFGMGLGSCRSLLTSDEHLGDFAVRDLMGDQPLYANLGVAQIEQLQDTQDVGRVYDLLEKLEADGLIIHINPMQEALQPEGDRFGRSSLETITRFVEDHPKIAVIVKEVGQGMGIKSLEALLKLPIVALDFAASGGTNFALLELLRNTPEAQDTFAGLARVGHTAAEMVDFLKIAAENVGSERKCRQIIASGGIKDFLDGYYATEKINTMDNDLQAVYGQASSFLKHARGEYEELRTYILAQLEGYRLAKAFLQVR